MTEEQKEFLDDMIYEYGMTKEHVLLCFLAKFGEDGDIFEELLDYVDIIDTL